MEWLKVVPAVIGILFGLAYYLKLRKEHSRSNQIGQAVTQMDEERIKNEIQRLVDHRHSLDTQIQYFERLLGTKRTRIHRAAKAKPVSESK